MIEGPVIWILIIALIVIVLYFVISINIKAREFKEEERYIAERERLKLEREENKQKRIERERAQRREQYSAVNRRNEEASRSVYDTFYRGEQSKDRKYNKILSSIWEKLNVENLEGAFEIIKSMWENCDPEADAWYLHTVLETLVHYMYAQNPRFHRIYWDEFFQLCELDISNYVHYINITARTPQHRVYRIPTYYAIALEKNSRLDEAIDFCEYCEQLNIPDHGYGDFSRRRAHLISKKNSPVRRRAQSTTNNK